MIIKTGSLSQIGSLGAIILAVAGILAYIPGLHLFGSIKETYIPMAPSTALSFLILGVVMFLLYGNRLSEQKMLISQIATLFVFLFGILEVAGFYSGIDLNFEGAIFPVVGDLHGVPIARMSPATGALFSLSGLALFLLIILQKQTNLIIEHVKNALAVLTLLISLIFFMAYLYGTPLLYGQGATIPMALTTALGFLFIALSILTFDKKDYSLSFSDSTAYTSIVVISIIVATIGLFLIQNIYNRYDERITSQLKSIVDLKSKQTELWLNEKKRNADVLRTNQLLKKEILNWLRSKDAAIKENILNHLEAIQNKMQYKSVSIVDKSGMFLMSTDDKPQILVWFYF